MSYRLRQLDTIGLEFSSLDRIQTFVILHRVSLVAQHLEDLWSIAVYLAWNRTKGLAGGFDFDGPHGEDKLDEFLEFDEPEDVLSLLGIEIIRAR